LYRVMSSMISSFDEASRPLPINVYDIFKHTQNLSVSSYLNLPL